ncbi:MAG: DNA repair protein RecN [Parachlamydiaceae bacterium]|nr:DNA repair protein RecN [Parachlamydiaceae bacterium]
MLKELRIFNIILIEAAEIFFEKGLNVITGETGSGKSAIIHALGLIMGARADTNLIRKGKEKGAVEALFEGVAQSDLKAILEDAGINCDADADLIIRREISSNGKSRAFINNQFVQISILKAVGDLLIESVSQHATRHLLSLEAHRNIIDLYGELEDEVFQFKDSWEKEILLQSALSSLVSGEGQRLREIETCLNELEELQEAALKEGEDEELFAEYSLLMSGEELSNKSASILDILNGEKHSVIQLLNRQKGLFNELIALDPALSSTFESFATASIELQEVAYTLTAYHSRIDCNPMRCERLNDRLTLISQLKRKYGTTLTEIQEYQEQLSKRLLELENSDVAIEKIKEELSEVAIINQKLAEKLTIKRKKAAKEFGVEIVKQLSGLNMEKVEFQVDLAPQKRSRSGDDHVEFFLLPNVGEHRIPIRECASGGELSRVLLALHVVLAGKQKTPTLVFDEIDEGVGGKTATLIGEKLREIGVNHQVLCITHFPQVAKQAAVHLQISKAEKKGRTATEIQTLAEGSREQEISRMLGT